METNGTPSVVATVTVVQPSTGARDLLVYRQPVRTIYDQVADYNPIQSFETSDLKKGDVLWIVTNQSTNLQQNYTQNTKRPARYDALTWRVTAVNRTLKTLNLILDTTYLPDWARESVTELNRTISVAKGLLPDERAVAELVFNKNGVSLNFLHSRVLQTLKTQPEMIIPVEDRQRPGLSPNIIVLSQGIVVRIDQTIGNQIIMTEQPTLISQPLPTPQAIARREPIAPIGPTQPQPSTSSRNRRSPPAQGTFRASTPRRTGNIFSFTDLPQPSSESEEEETPVSVSANPSVQPILPPTLGVRLGSRLSASTQFVTPQVSSSARIVPDEARLSERIKQAKYDTLYNELVASGDYTPFAAINEVKARARQELLREDMGLQKERQELHPPSEKREGIMPPTTTNLLPTTSQQPQAPQVFSAGSTPVEQSRALLEQDRIFNQLNPVYKTLPASITDATTAAAFVQIDLPSGRSLFINLKQLGEKGNADFSRRVLYLIDTSGNRISFPLSSEQALELEAKWNAIKPAIASVFPSAQPPVRIAKRKRIDRTVSPPAAPTPSQLPHVERTPQLMFPAQIPVAGETTSAKRRKSRAPRAIKGKDIWWKEQGKAIFDATLPENFARVPDPETGKLKWVVSIYTAAKNAWLKEEYSKLPKNITEDYERKAQQISAVPLAK